MRSFFAHWFIQIGATLMKNEFIVEKGVGFIIPMGTKSCSVCFLNGIWLVVPKSRENVSILGKEDIQAMIKATAD
jgi:hypothetical protein